MTTFTVHTVIGSPFGRSVIMALEEKQASYRLVEVKPGTTKSSDHLALHPFGRVPVLVCEGFRLYETQAILRYLDRVLPDPALTPHDPKIAGMMDLVMNVSDWYLFQGVNNVIGFQRIILPRLMGGTADEDAIAACLPKAHALFDELGRILGNQDYFAGAGLTLADLLVAPQLDFLAETPEWPSLTAAHPNLPAWLARMNARASMKATTWTTLQGKARAAG